MTLLCLSMLLSFFSLKSIRFRGLVCGYPTVIIREGKVLQQNMARNRFTVDELLEQLRSQGYSDLSAVKYAVLETSGQVSVLPYTKAGPVTPQSMNLEVQDDVTLPVLLINDGRVMSDNLSASGYDAVWLPLTRGMPKSCMGTAARSEIIRVSTSSLGSSSPICRFPISRRPSIRIK